MGVAGLIASMFEQRGDSQYGGEPVTQLEHALQCAHLAEQNQAPPALIVAALLHDIGHLLHDLPDEAPDQGIDDIHEERGFQFLQSHFSAAVTEPVRLHVAAKRYLCAVDAEYERGLSEPSRVSLKLQGGKMDAAEQASFRTHPHWQAAVQLRRWDDLAKAVHCVRPELPHFMSLVAAEVALATAQPGQTTQDGHA